MDFFEYSYVATFFTNNYWVKYLIGGLCFALVFVFQGVALFTIASREGYKRKWMAFVPFFNTYYIGVCAQKNRFYNIDTKKIGIAAAVFEATLFMLYILNEVACILVIDYEDYVLIDSFYGQARRYYVTGYPESLNWAAWIYTYMDSYILSIMEIVYLLLQISLLICFFQTYACRRYVLFTITSILFPIQGILFFVVRGNKGVNYREFIRAEQARQYQAYQQYQQQFSNQNPYSHNNYNGNPYNQNDNYGSSSQTPPDDPFEGFGGSGTSGNSGGGGSPFDEFDN